MAVTYLAVGDDGRILCSGSFCSGTQTSGTDNHLKGVAKSSFTFNNGVRLRFVVGDDGVILRMRADGLWRRQESGTTRNLNDVGIVPGGRTAWAVGDEGTILKTIDAGVTWGVQRYEGRHLRSIAVINDQVACAAGDDGAVLFTKDGGGDWKGTVTQTSKHLRAIVATSDNSGLAVGDDGTVIAGTFGYDWEVLLERGGPNMNGVAAFGPKFVVVGDDGLIMVRKWSTFATGSSLEAGGTSKNLNAVAVNGDSIIVVGDDGAILVSKDEGNTWKRGQRGTKSLRAVV